MSRYKVQLSYDGTNFHGWQRQNNAQTVQETIEKSISLILKETIEIVGAGRTDTGVHSEYYIAHFDTEEEIKDVNYIVFRLNSFLPDSIAIQKIELCENDFHARFSAISRTYEYRIHTKKKPFLNNYSTYIYHDINIEKMNQAAEILMNYSDFTSFSKLHTDVKTNNCKILEAKWDISAEDFFVFRIKADRFLRNMVRAIVGTLLDVGKEKISIQDFEQIIKSKNRSKAGVSVPAQGLFLVDICY